MPPFARQAALLAVLGALLFPAACRCPTGGELEARGAADAAASQAAFARLAALEGAWVGPGPPDAPGEMTVTYELTAGGSAVLERLFAGAPDEMVTLFALEGDALVLTHYCSLGNQPRMRARPMTGNTLDFDFIGGANIDPATDHHLHNARFEFVSDDELVTAWTGWTEGRPDAAHSPRLRFKRKG